MSPTTTMEVTPVAPQTTILPRRRGGPVTAPLPGVIDSSPLADVVAEYRRLHGEHRAASQEIGRLERERRAAEHADRRALADALADGKRDPGDKTQEALGVKIAAAQRKLGGLADATSAAVYRVRDQVRGEPGARWTEQLDGEATKLRETLDEHLAEAVECFERLASLDAARVWVREAQENASIGASGLPPTVRPPKLPAFHIGGHQNAVNAVGVLRSLAAQDTVGRR